MKTNLYILPSHEGSFNPMRMIRFCFRLRLICARRLQCYLPSKRRIQMKTNYHILSSRPIGGGGGGGGI